MAGPRTGGEKVEKRVMVLVVAIFGADGGVDFDGEGKRESGDDDGGGGGGGDVMG